MEITLRFWFGTLVLCCFWLPEILPSRLVRRPSECSPEELQRVSQAKLRRLLYVLAHVEAQLSVFERPPTEQIIRQYEDLMHT